ncbi:MAG TPA: MarR family transcriptional regulator [Chloroflexia bacterium]|nr:MarR family transcriptional regulator [Chloroflexia bacterium]
MDQEREELTETIIHHQRMMFEAMHSAETPEWLGSDLTMPQLKILFLLYSHGPMRMGDLAHALGKKISTATGIVDLLVEQSLIKREEDPDDRRVVIARLTEQAREVCESFLRAGWQQAQAMLSRLTMEELRTVDAATRIMTRVAIEQAKERESENKLRGSNLYNLGHDLQPSTQRPESLN